jgi:hypothetical protein
MPHLGRVNLYNVSDGSGAATLQRRYAHPQYGDIALPLQWIGYYRSEICDLSKFPKALQRQAMIGNLYHVIPDAAPYYALNHTHILPPDGLSPPRVPKSEHLTTDDDNPASHHDREPVPRARPHRLFLTARSSSQRYSVPPVVIITPRRQPPAHTTLPAHHNAPPVASTVRMLVAKIQPAIVVARRDAVVAARLAIHGRASVGHVRDPHGAYGSAGTA